MAKAPSIIPVERVAAQIYLIRGQTVMFDADLAALYGVETRTLVQAVKRNAERFPEDFMFRLTDKETENLRSQIVISSWGGRRYNPYAFTEHGVAMLSSVLKSKRAVEVNMTIVRTFVKPGACWPATRTWRARWRSMTGKSLCYSSMKHLLEPPRTEKPIGFIHPKG
jgi:hypothetical protein